MEIKFKKFLTEDDFQVANNVLAKILGLAPEGLHKKIKKNKKGEIEICYFKVKKSKYKKYLLENKDVIGVAFDEHLNRLYFLYENDQLKEEAFACIDWH
ncbi:hypothetical protein [Cetobacterium sp. SF1]|uniref:hypothetical protein n=1 Tax=Cetobacterium sp. SF1 TaxID=3417654 RepID=UPI003CE7481D